MKTKILNYIESLNRPVSLNEINNLILENQEKSMSGINARHYSGHARNININGILFKPTKSDSRYLVKVEQNLYTVNS